MSSISPTLQHYVPRFLLRRFGVGKKDHVWVYDKQTDRVFQASTGRIAAERGMYDFEFQNHSMTMERGLADLETKAATLTKRIVEARNLNVLANEDRAILAAFLAVQLVRTNAARAQFRWIGTLMATWLRRSAGNDADALAEAERFIGESSEADERLHLAGLLHQAPRDYSAHLLDKVWTLAETTRRHPFLIGDHPLAMSNSIDHSPRGSLGVAVRGIEIYLPLSPELQLCLYCPTLVKELETLHGQTNRSIDQASHLLACFEAGTPCRSQPENVEYCNSLQILHAERYVMGNTSEFDMVREMISADAAVRYGRRGRLAS